MFLDLIKWIIIIICEILIHSYKVNENRYLLLSTEFFPSKFPPGESPPTICPLAKRLWSYLHASDCMRTHVDRYFLDIDIGFWILGFEGCTGFHWKFQYSMTCARSGSTLLKTFNVNFRYILSCVTIDSLFDGLSRRRLFINFWIFEFWKISS